MRVTFDPKKDAINRRKHGISLARAADFDMTSAKFERDDSQDYGEERYNAVGWLDARLFSLTFVDLEEDLIRAICLRDAEPDEREEYADIY